ncbi:hypothetical protein KI387_009162 [Taxus chinensis]|uniref:Mitochondrial proton/calcium exchanger protein n=1 Tax=Taxus chinensis TaxID=29808 RepID=A0AA38CWP9_TAXCH|nr:hypothetical protein KI387_009162 [Taxus chinensis]
MASRQIDFYRRLIARKPLQSSEDAALSLRIFSHWSSDETDILHSTKWPSLQPLDKLPVEHDCQIVANDNVKENYQKPKNILYGSTKLWASISERTVFRDASTLSAARAISGKPVLPSGVRWISISATTSSPATATQHVPNNEEEQRENKVLEQRKIEASPEECDQAVAGLSSVKAKAKQAQELLKKDESIVKKEDWARKLSQWKGHFFEALQHYWIGTKLLWVDVRISFRLLLKLASGKSLSRRERQQLTRTTADIFRLVPFAVFIIVPFMEFLLPVFLKLFPNMLPSTFQDKMKEEEKLKRRLNARIEYAKFLQDTVKEMAREIKTSRSGELKQTAEDLDTFLSKVRTGAKVSNEEILGFAKLFNDELTLDNVSRPRLVNMCKYMGIKPYGTDAYLRYMLRSKLARIKEDDRMIQSEGFDALSEAELRQACRDRGMLGLLSVEEMRQQLRDWLDLSLNHSVPSSLLILSRAFTVSGKVKPEEAVQATLSSLPDELVDSVGVTAFPSEDSVADRRRKLEFLEMQEDLIKEEEKKEKEEQARLEEEAALNQRDTALQEMNVSTEREVQELASAKAVEKQEQLCKLSRALAVLASASSVSEERAEFLRLVNKEIGLYNSIVDKEREGVEVALKAYGAASEQNDQAVETTTGSKVSATLINRIDAMLQMLEKEIDDVDAKIGDRWRLLDRDYDGKVTPEEVAAAALYLKDTLGQEPLQKLISDLAKDKDGKILVEDIVKLGASVHDEDQKQQQKELPQ